MVNNYNNLTYYAMEALRNLARTSMRARAAFIYLRTKVKEIQTITGSGCSHCRTEGKLCVIHQLEIAPIEGVFYNGALGEPWPTGKLVATHKFDKPLELKNGDQLKITYSTKVPPVEIPRDFFIDDDGDPVDIEINARRLPDGMIAIDTETTGPVAMYGYVMPTEPDVTCKCLGCGVEATAPKANLTSAGWSDMEPDTAPGSTGLVGICMRDACRKRFGLPELANGCI